MHVPFDTPHFSLSLKNHSTSIPLLQKQTKMTNIVSFKTNPNQPFIDSVLESSVFKNAFFSI
ncbi:hypothetical protein B4065_2566 [Caldibacillus thermoamylovorans]|nr:hypothetical protein B4065_2566 [Caldibacillus thermoamylovorans]